MTIENRIITSRITDTMFVNGNQQNNITSFVKNGRYLAGGDRWDYRRLISSGLSAVNPLSSTFYRENLIHGGYAGTSRYGDQLRQHFNAAVGRQVTDSWFNDQLILPNLNPKVDFAILQKIRKKQSGWSGYVVLGELRKTIGFLRSPFKQLARHMNEFQKYWARDMSRYRALRKKGPVSRKFKSSFRETLRHSYLEFTFGLQPLISDVEDIAKSAAYLNDRSEMMRIFHQERAQVSTIGSLSQRIGLGTAVSTFRAKKSRQQKLIVGFRRPGADPVLANQLVRVGGFNLSELVPAAWELIPYSWLVDYVVNLGDILSAMTVDTSGLVYTSRTIVDDFNVDLISVTYTLGYGVTKIDETKKPVYSGFRRVITRDTYMPVFPAYDISSVMTISIPSAHKVLNAGLVLQPFFFRK